MGISVRNVVVRAWFGERGGYDPTAGCDFGQQVKKGWEALLHLFGFFSDDRPISAAYTIQFIGRLLWMAWQFYGMSNARPRHRRTDDSREVCDHDPCDKISWDMIRVNFDPRPITDCWKTLFAITKIVMENLKKNKRNENTMTMQRQYYV